MPTDSEPTTTKLTKRSVESAKHTGPGGYTIIRDSELPGFALRVTAGGVRSYVVEYRRAGRRHRVTVGRHGPLTVEQARRVAQQALYGAIAGEDLLEKRRREREGDTLADVAERYLADLRARAVAGAKRGRLSGWEGARGLWLRHVPAALARRRVADLTLEDVRRPLKALAAAGKTPTADHLRTVLHAVLETARTEGLRPDNPVAAIKRYAKSGRRRRALSLEELSRLGAVLAEVETTGRLGDHAVAREAALTLRILALTGMRRSELLGHHVETRRGPREGLRWGDVDLVQRAYTLASHGGGSGGKGGGPRVLPLGKAAVELLEAIRPDGADPEAPVVAFVGLDKCRRRIYDAAGIEGADAHALRHTFETVAFEIAPAYAGALTGRALTRDSVLNAYLHVELGALREVADKVTARIAEALAGRLTGRVVAFRKGQR